MATGFSYLLLAEEVRNRVGKPEEQELPATEVVDILKESLRQVNRRVPDLSLVIMNTVKDKQVYDLSAIAAVPKNVLKVYPNSALLNTLKTSFGSKITSAWTHTPPAAGDEDTAILPVSWDSMISKIESYRLQQNFTHRWNARRKLLTIFPTPTADSSTAYTATFDWTEANCPDEITDLVKKHAIATAAEQLGFFRMKVAGVTLAGGRAPSTESDALFKKHKSMMVEFAKEADGLAKRWAVSTN